MVRNDLLWGDEPGVDFWTACARGQVPAPERRAVDLLYELCDKERVDCYCATGGLPVMGNVTGKIYVINRRYGIDELADGRAVHNWCIAIGDPDVPRTDSVIAIKNLIEGEELKFREIGNIFGASMSPSRPIGTLNPYFASIMDDESLKELKMAVFNNYGTLWHYEDDYQKWLDLLVPKNKPRWESRVTFEDDLPWY